MLAVGAPDLNNEAGSLDNALVGTLHYQIDVVLPCLLLFFQIFPEGGSHDRTDLLPLKVRLK